MAAEDVAVVRFRKEAGAELRFGHVPNVHAPDTEMGHAARERPIAQVADQVETLGGRVDAHPGAEHDAGVDRDQPSSVLGLVDFPGLALCDGLGIRVCAVLE